MDNDKATKTIDMGHDCTCHPDEAPIPCQHRYAFAECRLSFLEAENARLRGALGEIIELADVELDTAPQVARAALASIDHERKQ